MRVGVNLLWMVPREVGGSENWVAGLLQHIAVRRTSEAEVVVFAPPGVLQAHPWLGSFEVIRTPGFVGTSRPARVAAESTWLAVAARRARVEVVHHPGGTIPPLRLSPAMVTIHDLQPLAMPEHFSRRKLAYLRARLGPSARASRLVTAISEFTRTDIAARLGVPEDRIVLTPPAVDPDPTPPSRGVAAEVEAAYRLDRPFFLYPAITYPHKDHATVVRALVEVPDALLVLTGGGGPEDEAVRRLAEALGVAERVRRPGRVPVEHLNALYRGAVACTFPSRFEGVGIPVLEAMARGCPVLAADATALPAVVGGAGDLVAAGNIDAWARAMQRSLDDEGHRASLAAAGRRRVQAWAPAASASKLVAAWGQAAGG